MFYNMFFSGFRFPVDFHKAPASVLFSSIFVRKLPQKCISDTFQFADDTTLAAADPSLEVVTSILTTSFNATKEFCQSHGLIINPAKTQLIIFKAVGKRIPEDFHLTLDKCSISPQTTVKLLGVTSDQHLTFRTQIYNVVSKCHGLLGTLARATHIFLNSCSSWRILH